MIIGKFEQGVFIFYEWFSAAKVLSGLEFKKLFLAIAEYQLNGTEPPSFTPKGEALARVIFPCIKRRIDGAKFAERGAQEFKSDHLASTPSGTPSGVKTYTPYPKEKKNKEKYSNSSSEKDKEWQEFFDLAVSRSLKTIAPTDEPSVLDGN